MTAQIMDTIDFAGKVYDIASEPLWPWLNIRRNRKLRFAKHCSGLQRGYRTHWAVEAGNLFLTSFSATDHDGRELTLAILFPEAEERVPAKWFSGAIVCPMGELIRYEHWGYGSVYEYDLILWFIEGHLIEQRINRNPSASREKVADSGRQSDDLDEDMLDEA